MPKVLLGGLSALLVLVMLAFAYGEADAARIGGGRSFGGRPSMSTPYTKPTPSPTSPASPTMRQQANQATGAAAAPSRGLFGGMGGMLGGLLAGGLLGSMLFGGGMGAGGFGGILDILLIAVVAYFGFKFFARRRAASQQMGPREATQGAGPASPTFDSPAGNDSVHQRSAQPQTGGFDWQALTTPSSAGQTLYNDNSRVPSGFDEEEFLRGAKAAYTRLNSSWDKRDFQDISQFTTPAFLSELRRQGIEDSTPGKTEIMLVNATLLEVSTLGAEEIAQVYFNVLLREDPNQESPADVREVWHFVRPASGEGSWKLDGIQQVEN